MIWDATNKFGAVLENVVFDPETRIPDYDSDIQDREHPLGLSAGVRSRMPRAPAWRAIRRTSFS